MTTTTYTIAVLKAKPGKADALISAFETLAAETRKEAGVEEYGFIRDRQSPETILSYERRADAASEAAHWKTPHLKAAIGEFADILDGEPAVYKGPKII
ncbi:MAG: putative quinol monooxygenase [Pseudomonadota bacterium]